MQAVKVSWSPASRAFLVGSFRNGVSGQASRREVGACLDPLDIEVAAFSLDPCKPASRQLRRSIPSLRPACYMVTP